MLGKHSGRHALRARCKELGLTLDKAAAGRALHPVLALADRKKGILDERDP